VLFSLVMSSRVSIIRRESNVVDREGGGVTTEVLGLDTAV